MMLGSHLQVEASGEEDDPPTLQFHEKEKRND